MSELDEIKQAVEGTRNAVAEGKIAAEQAQTMASDKMNEFAGLGLEGVAQVLNTCADTMGTAVAQLGTAFSLCDETVNGLSGITDQTQISQTTQALDGAKQKLTTVDSEVQGAQAQGNEALQHAQHSEVEPVMNAVAHALGQIDQAKVANESAKSKAEQYRTQIQERAGNALLTAASSPAPPKPTFSTSPGRTATPLDAVPPRNREPIAKIGDPIQPPSMGPPESKGDYRQELDSADDEDKARSKFSRASRLAIRKASDIKKQTETTTSVHSGMKDYYRPPEGPTYETVGVADPAVSIHTPGHAHVETQDVAGTGVILFVAGMSWGARMWRNRKARKK